MINKFDMILYSVAEKCVRLQDMVELNSKFGNVPRARSSRRMSLQ